MLRYTREDLNIQLYLCCTSVLVWMDYRIFTCLFYCRQSSKTSCFQGGNTAGQSDFYYSLHTNLYCLHYGAFNEHGGNNRTKRNYRWIARDMASDGGNKFCYGFAAADIFGRSDLQRYFQSCIQTIINICRYYGCLPENYLSKNDALAIGRRSYKGNLRDVTLNGTIVSYL